MRSVKDFFGDRLIGPEGEIGLISDIYFDDFAWVVRYVVVETGDWLDRRKVLISPHILSIPQPDETEVDVSLTYEEIRNSPDISLERPISRAHEEVLRAYYKWPFYWEGLNITGGPLVELAHELEEKAGNIEDEERPHLLSAHDVFGYAIAARDGDIGHLEDMVIGVDEMNILYLVVDIGSWLPGRKVLLSPQWIEEFGTEDEAVGVGLDRETIHNSPPFDSTFPLNREYEAQLYDYYGRKK